MSTAVIAAQNQEAEEHVLGAMLLNQNAIATATEHVRTEDFYRPNHGLIFDACTRLYTAGHPVDAITIIDRLDLDGTLEQVGGRQRIHELANLVPATANVAHYAQIVNEMAKLRDLRKAGQQIIASVDEREDDARALLDQAEHLVFQLAQEHATADLVALEQTIGDTHERAVTRTEGQITGLATGYTGIDTLTSGLQPGNLVVLAARPSMGKTALALAIALHVAADQRKPAAFFSLEMSHEEINQRLLAIRAGVNLHHIRAGKLDDTDRLCLKRALDDLVTAPLYVDDGSDIRPIEIRSKARRVKARNGLSLIVVDYLQLMGSEAKPENRVQEVAQISRALKNIARDLDVPVLALSQLSRNLEFRADKRPMLSDLRESGSIEQDADLVAFIYRDSVYNTAADDTEAELILAKHRNGPTGQVLLNWQKQRAEFRNAT